MRERDRQTDRQTDGRSQIHGVALTIDFEAPTVFQSQKNAPFASVMGGNLRNFLLKFEDFQVKDFEKSPSLWFTDQQCWYAFSTRQIW